MTAAKSKHAVSGEREVGNVEVVFWARYEMVQVWGLARSLYEAENEIREAVNYNIMMMKNMVITTHCHSVFEYAALKQHIQKIKHHKH